MINRLVLTSALLGAILIAQSACAARTHRPAAAPTADVVLVAPPTGAREIRADSLAVPARPNSDASPADLARFAEEVLAESGVRDWAVALIRDGRVVERRFSRGGDGIGHAVDGVTTFDLASIAKPVMAWGVMRLVETGRVELDRPIESYLTRWRPPPSAFDHREVTVRRVLSHTAGLTATSSLLPAPDGARPPIEWFLEGRRLEVGFQPGTRYNYSGGYDLLELLIEEASGRDFPQFMWDEVLRPLGMDRTVFGLVQPDDPPLPRTNVLGGDVREENRIFSAASHLVGNLDGLTAFALAHLEDGSDSPGGRGVLQPATLDTMLTPVVDASSGLGYVLRRPRTDLMTAGHAGAGASLFRVAPATGDGLVILTNHAPGYAAIARIECVWLAWLAGTERRCPMHASYALMGAYQQSGVRGAFDYYAALVDRGGPDYEVEFATLSEFARMLLAAGRLDDAATVYRMMAGAGSDEAPAYGEVADRLVAGFQPQEDRLACYVGEYRSSAGGALRLERAGEGVTFTMIEPVPGLIGPLRPLSERVWVMRAGGEYPIELVFDLAPSGVATRVAVRVNDYRIAFSAERTGAVPTCPALPAEPAGAAADGRAMEESGATGSEAVHVAPPTGQRETDRASILAALEQVQPGRTIRFAAGTYLVGEIVPVTTPRITLLGHPQGTTLRGCDPAEYEEMEWAASRAGRDWRELFPIIRSCGTFELSGGHSTIRGLTFEYTRMGVILGCCHAERDRRLTGGGYLIEGNTFRNSGNGIRPGMLSADPTVIRGNTFINTFHAVSAEGGHLHILENDISVPEPHGIPGAGHPSFAIALCGEHNLIAGNRIEGHPDGILLIADPGDACRENVIRDNTIAVRRVPFASHWWGIRLSDEADSTVVGVPLLLYAIAGEEEKGIVESNLIEGNRLLGSDGIAVEVAGASRNRFVGNTISGVVVRTPFPGNMLGSNAGWSAANGSGIWLSPGSDENEIVGNTFEDIAGHAVVIEGDRNRVETRSASDAVRDLGSGNRVSAPDTGNSPPPASQGSTTHRSARSRSTATLSVSLGDPQNLDAGRARPGNRR